VPFAGACREHDGFEDNIAMKTIILAGGLGTRLSEETAVKPKPLVEIGGRPILCHIMETYAAAGFCEFVVALGYKGELIKEYFLNFHALSNDLTIDLATGKQLVHGGRAPDWKIHLVDTGEKTQTGGRIRRLRSWVGEETFMVSYGDGLADLDVRKVVEFHRSHQRLATVTAARPPSRFGNMVLQGDQVSVFSEKSQTGEGWISSGFFVLEPGVFDYITGDSTVWERAPMERLAADGQLMCYRHEGFWQPMDTLREKRVLEDLWASGKAPWRRLGAEAS
jgi:glucose-1-phosphate cytidylyltransferase